jgi:hypothetical protein
MDYLISADPSWIDVDVVWRFLSEESYWARGVPREIVVKVAVSLDSVWCLSDWLTFHQKTGGLCTGSQRSGDVCLSG